MPFSPSPVLRKNAAGLQFPISNKFCPPPAQLRQKRPDTQGSTFSAQPHTFPAAAPARAWQGNLDPRRKLKTGKKLKHRSMQSTFPNRKHIIIILAPGTAAAAARHDNDRWSFPRGNPVQRTRAFPSMDVATRERLIVSLAVQA